MLITDARLPMKHESQETYVSAGVWEARCKCGWKADAQQPTPQHALRAYMRGHSDLIPLKDHYA